MTCSWKKSVLIAKDVDFFYGSRQVLQNIELVVKQGEFLGIAGPNGGGKTTLLRLLLGLLRPQRGSIELLGLDPALHRRGVGYVPQNSVGNAPFPLTLLETVLMGRLRRMLWGFRYSTSDVMAAKQALSRVDLLAQAEMPFYQLSGGQAQRGLIARALCAEAQILFLDEPTAHIDLQSQKRILTILQELKKEVTIVMVSHDWPAIKKCADRILYVRQSAEPMGKETICDHFALGLYHSPQKRVGRSDE